MNHNTLAELIPIKNCLSAHLRLRRALREIHAKQTQSQMLCNFAQVIWTRTAGTPGTKNGGEMRSDSLGWIRVNVPIAQVAGALGLKLNSNGAHCWRSSNHTNGDKHPSLGFTSKNRFKCFVCDRRPGSNLDLVMAVLGSDLTAALEWMRQRFTIPDHVPARGHTDPDSWKHVTLESIVQCGVWANLRAPQRSILVALWTSRQPNTGLIRLSYSDLLRLSGLSSRKTVSATIECFERMHLLEVQRADRRVSVYQFVARLEFLNRQRESLEVLSSDNELVPSGGTRSERSKLVPLGGTGSLGTLHTGLSSPIGEPVCEFSPAQERVLRLAHRGLLLFPCKPREKTPCVSNWQMLATADAAKIVRWFEKFPDCNWAVKTG